MLFRDYHIWDRLTLDDSGTKTADVKARDPITEILVQIRMQNGATDNNNNWVGRNVQSIELIDGAKVLWSLDGCEAFMAACDYLKRFPHSGFSEIESHNQYETYIMAFGRYFGDREYAFDPTKFVNPQVRITWNHSTVRDNTATSFVDGGVKGSIIARTMEGAPAPAKMLVWKQVKVWTTADGTVEYIELPVDYSYRKLMIRLDVAAYALSQLGETIKFNCDHGKYVPLDMRWYDFVRGLIARNPQLFYRHSWKHTSGDTGYCVLKQNEGVVLNCSQPHRFAYYNNYGIGEAAVTVWDSDTGVADDGNHNLFANCMGWCPNRSIVYDFGVEDEPATWFPTREFNDVTVELIGETAAATGYLALQQELPAAG